MSENMTPEQIYGQLNEYFEEMCKIVFEHGGYVDKFIGDCLMPCSPRPIRGRARSTASRRRNRRSASKKRIIEMMTEWKEQGRQLSPWAWASTPVKVVNGQPRLERSPELYGDRRQRQHRGPFCTTWPKGGQTIISERRTTK